MNMQFSCRILKLPYGLAKEILVNPSKMMSGARSITLEETISLNYIFIVSSLHVIWYSHVFLALYTKIIPHCYLIFR